VRWSLESRRIDSLYEYPFNPRVLDKEQEKQLLTSLEKFGLCQPVVINLDGGIIGGHQRARSLRKLGHKNIDVLVPDVLLEEKEFKELNIRLNKNTGDWDWDMLGNAWDPSDLIEWGFSLKDLHVGEEDDQEEKAKKYQMVITFVDETQSQKGKEEITELLLDYPGVKFKIKEK
jgi:ParB-like chromosome segregation protein Spo0J